MHLSRSRLLLAALAVAAVALAATSCRIIPNPALANLVGGTHPAGSRVMVIEDLAYGEARGCIIRSDVLCSGSQTLDLYRSSVGDASDRPLLIWVHGGGWTLGDKSEPLPANVLRQLDRGYDVLAVNYRLAPAHPFPAALLDVKLAVRWAKAHASERGWDPSAIVVVGHSAGGNLAALVATTAGVDGLEPTPSGDLARFGSGVAGAVAANGVLDLNDTAASDPIGAAYVRGYVGCVGCDRARQASVAGRVTASAAPLYLVHGAQDAMSRSTQGISVCLLYTRVRQQCSIDIVDTGPTQFQGHDVSLTLNQTELERFIDDVAR